MRNVVLSADGTRIVVSFGYGAAALAKVWDVASGSTVGGDLCSDIIGPRGLSKPSAPRKRAW